MNVKVRNSDLSTERKVLNLMFHHEEAIEAVVSMAVTEDVFTIERHKLLFSVLLEIYSEDAVSVGDDFDMIITRMVFDDDEDKKKTLLSIQKIINLKLKGGKDVELKLMPTYLEDLKKMLTIRKIIKGVQNINTALCDEGTTLDELAERVESLSSASLDDDVMRRVEMKDAVNETVKEIISEADSDRRVKFYINDIDSIAKIPNGYVTYIAGDSGIGKSAFLLRTAYEQSRHGVKILYVTPEMNIPDCVRRIISMKENISSQKLTMPKLMKAKDWKAIENMLEKGEIQSYGIHWLPSTDMDIPHLATEIKRAVRLHDIDVVMIDYYQLLNFDNDQALPDGIRIPKVSRALNVLAGNPYISSNGRVKEISIVALAQVTKEILGYEDKHPSMHDLYFGGYKDARLVLGLYRDEYYYPESTTKPNVLEVGVLKQNNGITNEWCDVHYDSTTYGIRELTSEEKDVIGEADDEDEEE
jgi:replicative DNA helicase